MIYRIVQILPFVFVVISITLNYKGYESAAIWVFMMAIISLQFYLHIKSFISTIDFFEKVTMPTLNEFYIKIVSLEVRIKELENKLKELKNGKPPKEDE